MKRTIALLLALAALPLAATAQTTAFTYQGRLNDAGAPANGFFDLRFSLHDAATNGASIGSLTNAATPVSNGLFTVALDFGAGAFPGANRWLELAVRTNSAGAFTALDPRQQITATPYAIKAASAGAVAAAGITGPLSLGQLPGGVVTNGASGVNISGTFAGNGAAITNVNLLSVYNAGVIQWSINWGPFTLASSPAVGNGPHSVAAADVNGDGKVDLVSANYGSSSLTVLTNNGSGGFVLSSSPSVGSWPYSVAAADVNGDGKVDLVSANNDSGDLTVLTNNGTGVFVLSSSPGVGTGPFSVAAADVNGDGKVDLVSANSSSSSLTVLTNNGAGVFALSSSPGVGSGPFSVAAADVNGDGKLDLVSANHGSSSLTVLTNNGAGVFVLSSSPGVGSGPFSVAAADVNGDGKVDLVSANLNSSTLTVLTNKGSGGFVLSSSPGVGTGPVSVAAADINGDGKVDLVSANLGSSTLTVLTNTALAQATFLGGFLGNGAGLTNVQAADADKFDGLDSTAFVRTNGAVFGGDVRLSNSNLWLRSGTDTNSGLGWYGSGKAFAGTTPDGPVLFGYSGGALGTRRGGDQVLLSWDYNQNVVIADTNASPNPLLTLNGNGNANNGTLSIISSGGGRVIRTGPGGGTWYAVLDSAGAWTATAFNSTSDRNMKENLKSVDARAVLAKVAALPISRWNFTNAPSASHIGPMAQDFHAAFGLGEDDRHIATVDADGVALAAIQGLNEIVKEAVKEKDAQIQALQQSVGELKSMVRELMQHKSGGAR